jgi:hypothetical protein
VGREEENERAAQEHENGGPRRPCGGPTRD